MAAYSTQEHPHTPDWFRLLYEHRGSLTAGEFYWEFWEMMQRPKKRDERFEMLAARTPEKHQP